MTKEVNRYGGPDHSQRRWRGVAGENLHPRRTYIETPRCTTCEECIKISRMFLYTLDIESAPYRRGQVARLLA